MFACPDPHDFVIIGQTVREKVQKIIQETLKVRSLTIVSYYCSRGNFGKTLV